MEYFEIVAHRGITTRAPENTLEAFKEGIKLGADAVELDVRLTKDKYPIVYHYFYLNEITDHNGPIFDYTYEEIQDVNITNENNKTYKIPSLKDVLEIIGGRCGLEIEIKGPEINAPKVIGKVLTNYEFDIKNIEITSYEPILLKLFKKNYSKFETDLLIHLSEPWMNLDVISYIAVHKAYLAGARAVHLHPNQLNQKVVNIIRSKKLQVHAWNVNDHESLEKVKKLKIKRICTDDFRTCFEFRKKLAKSSQIKRQEDQ